MYPSAKASVPVIRRLPKYYRYLRALKEAGVGSISSREQSAETSIRSVLSGRWKLVMSASTHLKR